LWWLQIGWDCSSIFSYVILKLIGLLQSPKDGETIMDKEMKSILMGCILVVALLFMASSDIMASEFVCGSSIITVGDRRYDVLRKCGDPSHVESWEEVRIRRDVGSWMLEPEKRFYLGPLFVNELVTIEEWEYNLGPTRFIRYLRFENGRLTRVTAGDYGYY